MAVRRVALCVCGRGLFVCDPKNTWSVDASWTDINETKVEQTLSASAGGLVWMPLQDGVSNQKRLLAGWNTRCTELSEAELVASSPAPVHRETAWLKSTFSLDNGREKCKCTMQSNACLFHLLETWHDIILYSVLISLWCHIIPFIRKMVAFNPVAYNSSGGPRPVPLKPHP